MTEHADREDAARSPEEAFLAQRDVLFAYIYAHVRNWSDAEDIFQETAKVALAKIAEGLEVMNISAWAREIARRLILAHWRSKKKRGEELYEETQAAIENAFRRMESADQRNEERIEALLGCVEKLQPHQKSIVELFYGAQLTLTAIATRLGRSCGAVQVGLSRIRKALLNCVEQGEREAAAHDA